MILHHCSENILQQFSDYLLLFRDKCYSSSVILHHCSEIHTAVVLWLFTLVQRTYCSSSVILQRCSEISTAAVQWFFTIVQRYKLQKFSDFSPLFRDKDSSNIKTFFYDNSLWNAITISYEPRKNWELTIKRYVSNVTGIFQEYNSDTEQQEKQCSISAKDKYNYVHSMTRITL